MNKKPFLLATLTIFVLFLFNAKSFAVDDFLVEETLKEVQFEQPISNTNYDYTDIQRIPIKLQLEGKISTKENGGYEGQELVFSVKQNVKYNGKVIIPKGEKATAKVETIMTKGMNGIPAMIIVDNFKINGIDSNKIKGTFIKKGADLSWLVFPIKWALTIIPPTGSFTNLITGGNATIDKKTNITLYYYPNWK